MHQFGVGTLSARGEFVEHVISRTGGVAETLDVEEAGLQGRGQKGFEVAMRDLRFGVLGGDHLTLFGDAQRPVHGSWWLCPDGVVAGSAATTHGAATSVEEP